MEAGKTIIHTPLQHALDDIERALNAKLEHGYLSRRMIIEFVYHRAFADGAQSVREEEAREHHEDQEPPR